RRPARPARLDGYLPVGARQLLRPRRRRPIRPGRAGAAARLAGADGPQQARLPGAQGADPAPRPPPRGLGRPAGGGRCRPRAGAELLAEVQRRLSAEERQLVELRREGLAWAAIAARLGGSPEALRKQHARALDRVTREVGLDDADSE